ncbi:hypothetical protein [Geoalkalibacter sp.]|uniref:hypothetical protein n=1 Tax=Geoalkalibacter sp. TaxID=3041440 RepID=UPI00272DFA05|nr:hypothetical protein [Geoalkalibacter sp.]
MSFIDPDPDAVVALLFDLLELHGIGKVATWVGVHEDTVRKWYRRENLPRRHHWFKLTKLAEVGES